MGVLVNFRKFFCVILTSSLFVCSTNAMKNDIKGTNYSGINNKFAGQQFQHFFLLFKRLYESKNVSAPLRVVVDFVLDFISVHLGKNHTNGPLIKDLKGHMNQLENCNDICPDDLIYIPHFGLCRTLQCEGREVIVGIERLREDNIMYIVLSDVESILKTMCLLISNKDFMSEFFPNGLNLIDAFEDFVERNVVNFSSLKELEK